VNSFDFDPPAVQSAVNASGAFPLAARYGGHPAPDLALHHPDCFSGDRINGGLATGVHGDPDYAALR
jgi:hypothetical protein